MYTILAEFWLSFRSWHDWISSNLINIVKTILKVETRANPDFISEIGWMFWTINYYLLWIYSGMKSNLMRIAAKRSSSILRFKTYRHTFLISHFLDSRDTNKSNIKVKFVNDCYCWIYFLNLWAGSGQVEKTMDFGF